MNKTIEAVDLFAGAVVNREEHKKDVAKALSSWVRAGLTIERVTVGWVREHGLEECEIHKNQDKQAV